MASSPQHPVPYYKQKVHKSIYHAKSSGGGIKYYVPNDLERHDIKKRLEKEINVSIPEKTPEVIEARRNKVLIEVEETIPKTHNFKRKAMSQEVLDIVNQYKAGELSASEAAKMIRAEDLKQIKEERKRIEAEIRKTRKENNLSHRKKKEKELIVFVGKSEVNFSALGIKKPNLSKQDRIWLDKAQYYFINAEERGIRVGSAAMYTTKEILEALWATAEHAGINPKRFLVQLYTESRFNPNLVGKAGERGLGQFKKSTANFHKFNWNLLKGGNDTYAYQAKSSATFVKMVGESAYNRAGPKGRRYSGKINRRLRDINKTDIPNIAENCC